MPGIQRIQRIAAQIVEGETQSPVVTHKPETKEKPPSITLTGGCFCGKVTYEIDTPTLSCGHCHCSMCRRMSMAAYVTWFSVPMKQLRIKGQEYIKQYESGKTSYRRHCSECGSQLFCDDRHEHPTVTVITFASLHNPEKLDRQPASHGFWTDKVYWCSVDPTDGLPRKETPSKYNPGKPTDFLVLAE